MKNVAIVIIVLIVIAVLVYLGFKVFKKPTDGTSGVVDTNTNNTNNIPQTKTCPDGSVIPIEKACRPLFRKGAKVYFNNQYSSDDVYVYTAPKAESNYIIGNTRASWWGTQPIGTFEDMAGDQWMKINVSGFQIYHYPDGGITKITQSVFVPAEAISNKPY